MSFKYFFTRPKYVLLDIVTYCCLNLQTFIYTQKAQKRIFQNPCSLMCHYQPFSPHIWDFCKYCRTLSWSTEASFKYFFTRPKYVIRDIVIYCCLNLQTLSCIQQAQNLSFLHFKLYKKLSILCLLCA